jgi:hypothetical protein
MVSTTNGKQRIKRNINMPSLQIQSMPQDLYSCLQELAFSQNDSLETQVIKLLYQAKQEK